MAGKKTSQDLHDSKRDQKRLEQDEATLDLPEVKDIPGQENILVPKMREMSDTTISSADEEGAGVWSSDEPQEDRSDERVGPAQEVDQNDLRMNSSEKKLEANLDAEELKQADDLEITDEPTDPEASVTPDEVEALERTENMGTRDNEDLYRAELDHTDFEDEKLNEDIEVSGEDLDIPGADLDDTNEDIGEEDEENNLYSLGDNE